MASALEDVYAQPISAAVTHIILTWSVLLLALSLVGNITVLVASVKYKAFKLDRVSVALIQQLAVADMMYLIGRAGLGIPGYISKEWLLGDFMCAVVTCDAYLCAIASMNLICIINTNKMFTLKYPLKSRLQQRKTGHILGACVWVLGVSSIAMTWALTDWNFIFRSNIMHCLESAEKEGLKQIIMSVYLLTPTIIIVFTTGWLMWFVHNKRGLQAKGVVTLILISIAFLISWTPYGVYNTVMPFVSDATVKKHAQSFAIADTICVYIMYINFSVNPIIFYLSINSFNTFVKKAVLRRKWSMNVNKSIPMADTRLAAEEKETTFG